VIGKGEFPPIVDLHVDFLLNCESTGRDFLTESADGHVDLPRARRGGVGAIFASVYLGGVQVEANAVGHTMKYLNDLLRLVDRSEGQIRIAKTRDDLDDCLSTGAMALILHFEGAEAISGSLKELRVFYELGLRSLGLVWTRSNIFGHGVMDDSPPPPPGPTLGRILGVKGWPLPSGVIPDVSHLGLTELGKELVRECNRLGIVIDVAHLNIPGFWDVLEVTEKPVIATHSGAISVRNRNRYLTDEQIKGIAENDGLIGVMFSRNGPVRLPEDTAMEALVAQFDHIVQLVGDRYVAIGSDYDGSSVPNVVSDASKLPDLLRALKARGYSDVSIERICNENLRRVLDEVWHSDSMKQALVS
jgi:membrane dipeptidase